MSDSSRSTAQFETAAVNEASWPERYSILLLVLVTLASLLPFSNKAVHIDDPLYLWTAQHITQHPFDPYGFQVVWYETETPIGDLINNPPLAPYYAAAWGSIFGWSERVMHLAFFFPALAVVLGTYRLARRFTQNPLWAAMITAFAPGFLVSSTTLMVDVLMLALWIWAALLWLEAVDSGKSLFFLGAAALAAACALAKFFGMALILLLPFYSLLRRKRFGLNLAYLAIPLLALALYQRGTHQAYGRGLLAIAMQYASFHNRGHEPPLLTKAIVAASFAGGCALPALLFIPSLWPRKWILAGLALCGVIGLAVARHWILVDAPLATPQWRSLSSQVAICALGGLSALALALRALSRRNNPDVMLLSLWVLGTFCFSAFVNWTVNARSLLPMIPAVAILLVQRLEQSGHLSAARFPLKLVAPLLASGLVAFGTAWADYNLANAGRSTAKLIEAEFRNAETPVYFEGHWGFQYYMQQYGAKPTDLRKTVFHAGDILVIPENTTNSFGPPPGFSLSGTVLQIKLPGEFATMSQPLGAGFYASVWGPLPFAFGPVPPERYLVARLVPQASSEGSGSVILKH